MAVYLDTETTGLKPSESRVVEVALVDDAGQVLLNTLVNPGVPIPEGATAIHGITDADVAGAPLLEELLPALNALVRGRQLVIYNSQYDIAFLPSLRTVAADVQCCMLAAQGAMGTKRWPKLSAAAEWAGHVWTGTAHRALADTLAARTVWMKIAALKVKP